MDQVIFKKKRVHESICVCVCVRKEISGIAININKWNYKSYLFKLADY